jgi:mannitol-1-phosphate 5-dehydrogenase
VKAVVVGAGRIGCGFAGDLLDRSGYELVFVTRTAANAGHLNRTGRYVVSLAGRRGTEEREVRGVRAVHAANGRLVASEIATADVIAISVGPSRLEQVAPLIAAGLARRRTPVNVLAFENGTDPGGRLRELVAATPGGEAVAARHGFSGALVTRIVARRIVDTDGDEPAIFVGDPPDTFVVDRRRLVCPQLPIEGMVLTDDWDGWVCRKLYLFSAAHVMTAYLGHLKGYHFIHSAIRDPEIRAAVLAAMAEAQAGLARRFGRELAGGRRDLREIVERFENAALGDQIVRVGRDPRRKLALGERLVGALQAAAQAGVEPDYLAMAVAAALCFHHPGDDGAAELARELDCPDPQLVLERVCGLDRGCGTARSVARHLERLAEGARGGGLLLRLDGVFWA